MKPEPMITRSDDVRPATRTLHGALTLAAWVLYAFLWLPLITLVAWLLGVRTTFIELHVRNHPFDPTLAITLPLLALACATLLIGWAEWNRWRFADRERRAAHDDVALPEVAAALHADPALGHRLAGAKSAMLVMDAEGRPLDVRVDGQLVPATR